MRRVNRGGGPSTTPAPSTGCWRGSAMTGFPNKARDRSHAACAPVPLPAGDAGGHFLPDLLIDKGRDEVETEMRWRLEIGVSRRGRTQKKRRHDHISTR